MLQERYKLSDEVRRKLGTRADSTRESRCGTGDGQLPADGLIELKRRRRFAILQVTGRGLAPVDGSPPGAGNERLIRATAVAFSDVPTVPSDRVEDQAATSSTRDDPRFQTQVPSARQAPAPTRPAETHMFPGPRLLTVNSSTER